MLQHTSVCHRMLSAGIPGDTGKLNECGVGSCRECGVGSCREANASSPRSLQPTGAVTRPKNMYMSRRSYHQNFGRPVPGTHHGKPPGGSNASGTRDSIVMTSRKLGRLLGSTRHMRSQAEPSTERSASTSDRCKSTRTCTSESTTTPAPDKLTTHSCCGGCLRHPTK